LEGLVSQDATRPVSKGEPFSKRLIFNRSSFGWQDASIEDVAEDDGIYLGFP